MEIGQVLIEVTHFDLMTEHHIAIKRFDLADDRLKQSRLAGTVIAHDADAIALMDLQAHFCQRLIITDLEMVKGQYVLASPYPADEFCLEGFGVGFFGILDLFHAFQILDLGLGKGCLILLVAELLDQFFQSLDVLLLTLVGGFLSDEIVLFLFNET